MSLDAKIRLFTHYIQALFEPYWATHKETAHAVLF